MPAFLVIILPTLITGIYYYGIAADQYLSEARFLVRGQTSTTMSLLGAFMSSGSTHAAPEELTNVADYMASHDGLRALQESIGVADLWRRPEADAIARLPDHPAAEDFFDYYSNRVQISIDSTTSLGQVRVRAFRPEDARLIAEKLLMLGEDVVNHFSDRQRSLAPWKARKRAR